MFMLYTYNCIFYTYVVNQQTHIATMIRVHPDEGRIRNWNM